MSNVSLNGTGVLATVAVVAIGAGAWWVYSNREMLAKKLSPLSQENVAYEGVNAAVQAVTGDKHATLGTKVFDAVDTVKGWFGYGEVDLAQPVVTYHSKTQQPAGDRALVNLSDLAAP